MTRAPIGIALVCALAASMGRAGSADAQDGGALPARDAGILDASVSRDLGDGAASDATADTARAAPTPEAPPAPPPGHEPLIASERTPGGDVHVGDLVTWTIRATVPEGDDVQMPRQTFRALEIRRRRIVPEGARDGKRTFVITIELVAFEPGEHVVGPVRLRVVTGDGQLGHTEVPALRVRVRSLLGNEPNAQPKPATRPVALIEEDPTLKYVGAALLAMLVGAVLALLLRRWWRRRPKVLPPPPPPRPVWEIALERLDALARDREAMMARGEASVWVDGLSDAVRAYLGGRYGFDGLECTTDEIVRSLRDARLGTLALPEIQTFLGDCDLAKFASLEPDEAQATALLELAYRIVHTTMIATTGPTSVMVATPSAPPGGPT